MIDDSTLTDEDFRAIVDAGLLAPSADNRHDVSFHCVGSSIEIWANDRGPAPPEYRRVLQLIGLGALAENMRLRARRRGWAAELTSPPAGGQPALIARMNFRRELPHSDELDVWIERRHTNRALPFRGPSLSKAQRELLESELAEAPSVRLLWLDERRTRQRVARLGWRAESLRLSSRTLHEELFSSIRFDVGWRQSAATGLPPGALGIARPLQPLFSWLGNPKVPSIAQRTGIHWLFGFRSGYLPCMLTPHLAALAIGKGSEVEGGSWRVGRVFERIWLRAAGMGLALQPLAAPAIYALDSFSTVAPRLNRRLSAIWTELCPEVRPLLVFRLGHAPPAKVRAGRPSGVDRQP